MYFSGHFMTIFGAIAIRRPTTDASYQVTVHLAEQFRGVDFLINQPIRNKNCLWRPCVLTERNEQDIGLYVLFRTFHDNFQVKLFPPKNIFFNLFCKYSLNIC
jgi:hypothetical protein